MCETHARTDHQEKEPPIRKDSAWEQTVGKDGEKARGRDREKGMVNR